MSEAATETDASNIELVAMENQAFDLIRQGQREAAMALLFSKEYERHKIIYSKGMEKINSAIQERINSALKTQRERAFLIITFAVVSLVILLFAWFGIVRLVGMYVTERKKTEEALKKAHNELEKKVEDRTADLRLANTQLKQEITQRKITENELGISEERYRQLMETANDAIFIADADTGIILNANKKAGELLGKPLEEIIGMHQTKLHPKEDEEYYRKIFGDHVQRSEGVILGDVFVWNKKGYEIPVEISASITKVNGKNIIQGIFRDMTERKNAEKEIKEGKEFLESVIESSRDGIAIVDEKGYILSVNTALVKMSIFSKEELLGKHASTLTIEDKELRKKILEKAGELLEKGFAFYEAKHKAREGGYINVECNTSMIKDNEGNSIAGVAIIRDITDRKRAEDSLRKSEEKYHNLIEHANDAIVSINIAGMIIDFNKRAEEMFGYPREEMLGKPSYLLIAQQHRENQKRIIKEFAETGTSVYLKNKLSEGKGLRKDGKEFSLEISYYILNIHGEPIATAIIRDISERKETEEKLIHNQEQLRSLASQLTNVEERERRNIASYLHDQLGQELFAMKLRLEQLKKSSPANHTVTTLESVIERTNQMMSDMRSMSYELSPPILYELGLEAALGWIVEEMRTLHAINSTFTDDGQVKPLEETTKILLFQAVRELLHNVTRHAKAQNVEICIERDNAMVVIQVNDDGIGFEDSAVDASREKNRGFGLYSIKERLKYIGGDLDVESARNRGARIILKAPLKS
jgi:PAS domain S-box-containing protein